MDKKKIGKRIKHYVSVFMPVLLLLLGGIFFTILTKTGGASSVLSGFKYLLFWLSGLLTLLGFLSVINDLITFAEKSYERRNELQTPKKERALFKILDPLTALFKKCFRTKKKASDLTNEESNDAPPTWMMGR